MNRRLYRCRHNRVLAGVASGVAEFFGLDPTVVRLLWFVSIFFGGFSLLLYIALAIIMPLEPLTPEAAAAEAAAGIAGADGHTHAPGSAIGGRLVTLLGIALIFFGGLALAGSVLPIGVWHYLWPAFLIGLGALLVVGALRRESNGG